MSTEIIIRKQGNILVPVDAANMEEIDGLSGEYKAVLTKPRNLGHHKKFFALLKVAFDGWEPEPVYHKGMEVKRSRERFRKELIVLAGYYTETFNLNGELRLEPKSISFSSMTEDDFTKLYSAVVDVILLKVLTNYTKDDLDSVVEQILGFI